MSSLVSLAAVVSLVTSVCETKNITSSLKSKDSGDLGSIYVKSKMAAICGNIEICCHG